MRKSTGLRATHGLAIVAALWLGAPAAHAAPAQSAAYENFEKGRVAFQAGRFEDALAAFQASLELEKSPNSRLYVARCYRALGKFSSAYTTYRTVSAEAEDRARATGEARYRATRDAADKEGAALKAKISTLEIGLPAEFPAGVVITIDGTEQSLSVVKAPMPLDSGSHTIVARGGRIRPVEIPIHLAVGETKHVDVTIARIPTATFKVSWRTRPSVFSATFDGKALDPGAIEAAQELDIGVHTLVVTSPGYQEFRWSKSLDDGETADVPIELRPEERPVVAAGGTPKWLFFTVAGAAVATFAVGTVFYVSASGTIDDQESLDPLLRSRSAKESAEGKLGVSRILYGASGVFAIGAATLLFTTRWKSAPSEPPPSTGTRVVPWTNGAGGGLAATGTF